MRKNKLNRLFLIIGIVVASVALIFVMLSYLPQWREDGTILQYNHGPQGREWLYPIVLLCVGFFLILWGIKPAVFKKLHQKWLALCELARKKTGLCIKQRY
jgi:hypothetical protein